MYPSLSHGWQQAGPWHPAEDLAWQKPASSGSRRSPQLPWGRAPSGQAGKGGCWRGRSPLPAVGVHLCQPKRGKGESRVAAEQAAGSAGWMRVCDLQDY